MLCPSFVAFLFLTSEHLTNNKTVVNCDFHFQILISPESILFMAIARSVFQRGNNFMWHLGILVWFTGFRFTKHDLKIVFFFFRSLDVWSDEARTAVKWRNSRRGTLKKLYEVSFLLQLRFQTTIMKIFGWCGLLITQPTR